MDILSDQRKYAKGLAVRERIVSAACRRFAALGYGGCSVTDLADAAKVSRNQLFHHFGSKERILEAAIERAGQAWSNELIVPAEIYPEATNRLVFIFDRLIELAEGDWPYDRLLAMLALGREGLPAGGVAALDELLGVLQSFLRRLLKDARREGGLVATGKARVMAGHLLAVLLGSPAAADRLDDGEAAVLRQLRQLYVGEAAGRLGQT